MLICNAVSFSVTAGKLSDGPKEILEFYQTSELMLAENVGIEGSCHGTRAPCIPDTVQVPRLSLITETPHPWFLPNRKMLCKFPFYPVAQQYGNSIHLM